MIIWPWENRQGPVDYGSADQIDGVLMTITKGHGDHIGVVPHTIKVRLSHGITTEKEESH
jgi:hypothetical protein